MTRILRDNKAVIIIVASILTLAMTGYSFSIKNIFYPSSSAALLEQKVSIHIESAKEDISDIEVDISEIKTDLKKDLAEMRVEQNQANKQIIEILIELGKK